MCYFKRHHVEVFHLKKFLTLMNGIILAINGRATLRPLVIYFRLFTYTPRDNKYSNQCTYVFCVKMMFSTPNGKPY